ncbi:MAG: hypothetical protein VYD71_02110 [Bacteroidota bacterium]|nr:hypothetical protein [Bacteroidota bacterium]
MIKFFANNEIDKQRWDSCLEQSEDAKVYAYSWYLDVVSPNWAALIEDDYKSIFPIPIKKKFGISYIAQPLFTQQLGLFSIDKVLAVQLFLEAIPKKFWLRSLQIHSELKNIQTKDNFELDVSTDIDKIRKKYSQNVKRNLKKAAEQQFTIKECDNKSLIQLFKEDKGKEVMGMNNKAYSILSNLLDKLKEKKKGNCYGLFKDTKLISGAFFANCFGRSIYLFSASNAYAKEVGANHSLIDSYIQHYKKESVILDFEGSMIPSLARFYASFGAVKKSYYLIKRKSWK